MTKPVAFHIIAATALTLAGMSVLSGCSSGNAGQKAGGPELVNRSATFETKALFHNLRVLSDDYTLFGHQDALAYGVHWINEPGRSDVMEITGSYPAVYGWELGDLELGNPENLDAVNFEQMKGWIREGFLRGGVITISWHMNNPATGGNSWDTGGDAVRKILPGGELHDTFTTWLDAFAETGNSTIYVRKWFTERLYPVLARDGGVRSISYVLVWRNANAETDRVDHYYAPYAGHPAEDDFLRFSQKPDILFEDNLPDMV